MSSTSLPLLDRLWHVESRLHQAVRAAVLVAAGSVALTVAAKVQVPFIPVPFTMQTAVVLMIGLTFGQRLGAATVGSYLAQGAVGLPVFAAGGGATYLISSPTAGYLWGMLAATLVMGWFARNEWANTRSRTLVAALVGTGVIFAIGVVWLAAQVGMELAVAAGLRPFLVSEALKIGLVAGLLPEVQRVVSRLDR